MGGIGAAFLGGGGTRGVLGGEGRGGGGYEGWESVGKVFEWIGDIRSTMMSESGGGGR